MAAKVEHEIIALEDWKEFLKSAEREEKHELFLKIIKAQPENSYDYFLLPDEEEQKELLFTLDPEQQEFLLLQLTTHNKIQQALENIKPDDLVDLFQNIGIDIKHEIWGALTEETKKVTKFLLTFDPDDAAGIMTPQYVAAIPTATVAQTIKLIRDNIDEVETIYYIYIVDRIGKLQGVVSLRDLMRRKDNVTLEEFMIRDYYYVQQNTNQDETVRLLNEHDLLAIPVTDKYHRLLGIVTIDDAVEIIQEERHEDMLKMSAITSELGKRKTYLHNSVFSLFQSRIPWLALLLIASTFTTNVINWFASFINSAAFLILFIPVITSTGGNTAVQSSTLIISGLAKAELSFKDILKIFFKELLVGLTLGLCLGLLVFGLGILLPPIITVMQGITLGISLASVVLFSSLIGILAPLIISKLGFDPTVIASPLIATAIDIIGLSIYFTLARMILKI